LTNVGSVTDIEYDDYYLPKKTTVNIDNGFAVKVTEMEYYNNTPKIFNPGDVVDITHGGVYKSETIAKTNIAIADIGTSPVNNDIRTDIFSYYIGRLKQKTETVTAYGDTQTSRQTFSYSKGLISNLKTFDKNNAEWINEHYTYDAFGNITEKKTSASSTGTVITERNEYDAKGRFVVSATDNLGLITASTYNDWGQVLTTTDPFGVIQTNTYDKWGKLKTSNVNISETTTYTYTNSITGSGTTVKVTQPHHQEITTDYNVWGQKIKEMKRGFGNKYISVETEYDDIGRKKRETEPFQDVQTDVKRWNTIAYTDNGNSFNTTVAVTLYNGKQSQTSISGKTTTVKELNGYQRTYKKTVDALGNVASSQDPGGTVTFKYDAAGNLLEQKYGNNKVTTTYDNWARKATFNDPSNGQYSYEYDAFSNLTKEISPKGSKEFVYNNKLQVQNETVTDNDHPEANKQITFYYNDKGQLYKRDGTSGGAYYKTEYTFDTYGRLKSKIENSNGVEFYTKDIAYSANKVNHFTKGVTYNNTTTQTIILNVYDAWSGELYMVRDYLNKILWELKGTNPAGQVTSAKLGGVDITNTYNSYNLLKNAQHQGAGNNNMTLSYTYDVIKNEVLTRTHSAAIINASSPSFNISESFAYDTNNRLISWTDPKTGNILNQTLDTQGRITNNDQIGTSTFGSGANYYRTQSINMSTAAQPPANAANLVQAVTYNENNDPLFIDGVQGDVRFTYGLTNARQMATYYGNFTETTNGSYVKFYSENGDMEVIAQGHGRPIVKIYIGSSPYQSNIVFLRSDGGGSGNGNGRFLFLHKDYLGSLLAISNESGAFLNHKHYDAWGNKSHNIMTGEDGVFFQRGYTMHEYFEQVGIIHMNGRLYDPVMHAFLNADENIQDIYNTQCYNKYGYVLNNPLLYSDPSGESITLAGAMLIGAVVGLVSYGVSCIVFDLPFTLEGAFKSTFFGAIGGAVTFGIGSVFVSSAGTATAVAQSLGKVGTALVQSGMHAVSQGALALMQGGDFFQGAASGLLGSLGASAFGAVAGNFSKNVLGKITFGAAAGGVGSKLSGGNFWKGALVGGIVAGLNHAAHEIGSGIERYNNRELSESEYNELSERKQRKYVQMPKEVLVEESTINMTAHSGGNTIDIKITNSIEVWGTTTWVLEKNLYRIELKTQLLYTDDSNLGVMKTGYYRKYTYDNNWLASKIEAAGKIFNPSTNISTSAIFYNKTDFQNSALFNTCKLSNYLFLLR
jgi:RHS repeat-associated protein